MANLNRIILAGQLASDPESRSTMDGIPMVKFRLAVARPSFGKQSETDLIDIVAWRKTAEDCGDRLKKSDVVLVEGRIQNRSFEDQAGQRRWVTEVVARSVQPMEKGSAARATEAGRAEELVEDETLGGDLPF